MKFNSTSLFILLLLCVACACNNKVYDESSLSNTSELITENDGVDKIPSVIERRKLIDEALKKPIPAILLNDSGNTNIKLAQELILDHPVLKNYFFNKKGDPMLNEVFTVQPATSGDLTALKLPSNNTGNNFYKVEWYNYPLNTTISFITDLAAKKVVSMQEYPNIQPDVNEALKRIAVDIATHSTYIQKELGTTPSASDAQMAYTKTALNKSRCERSHHLCVAPTFIKEQKALWSIVDLTDLKLVGYRWTFVGDPGPVRVTERVLQNEKITECFCKVENKIEQQGWKLNYMLTSSDGLKISEVAFNNKKVLSSAKLVDWHVSYSNSDGFGYSDGVGCPTFSTSAVLAIEAPKVYDLEEGNRKVGFVLEQKFYSEGWPNVCNYNYLQRYEFYADGRFRIACASLGRGCGNDGTYRPVYRIAFADAGSFAEYDGSDFKNWDTEKWTLQKDNSPATKETTSITISNDLTTTDSDDIGKIYIYS